MASTCPPCQVDNDDDVAATSDAEEADYLATNDEAYDGQKDTPEVQQAVRRADWCLIPVLFGGYALNFADKVMLSSASVMGLRKDTGINTKQYSWVSSAFYWGYLCTLVTAEIVPYVPWLLPTFILFCSVAVGCTAACKTYADLIVCRFFLGVFESVMSPGFLFITSGFYTREEIPRRVGAWFSGNSIGGMLSSIYAYGVGHIKHPLAPWQWLFIILAMCQFVYGLGTTVLLPLKISQARFLTPRQKYLLERRVEARGTGGTGKSSKHWEPRQIRECLMDPKTWIAIAVASASQIPNSATQNFSNIVLQSFGFSSLQTTLLNIPYSLLAATTIAGLGWVTSKSDRLNCYCIVLVSTICIIGSSLIYVRPRTSKGVQLFGYFLLSVGPSNFSLLLGLCATNTRGVTKKATFNALIFVFYSAANIAGPHLFRGSQAPKYQGAFCGIMVCYAITALLALSLRAYLAYANRQRDGTCAPSSPAEEETSVAPSSLDGATTTPFKSPLSDSGNTPYISSGDAVSQLKSDAPVDKTDWEDSSFRYRL